MDKIWLFILLTATAGWTWRIVCLLQSLRWMPFVNPGARPEHREKISVVIPMKNEETNARACVEALLKQDHPSFEIVVINDNSRDKTGEILKSLPIVYVENTTPTPEGWVGKTFAIHQGISKATGDWLLFTDADTRHEPTSLSAALGHCHARKLEFLTLLPRCICETFLEKVVQPITMAFLGLWFPIRKINDPDSSMHFANGQFLMIKRSLYEKLGKHEAVKDAFLEDFALAQKAKEMKAPMQCALGKAIYGTRMYESFGTIWRGWRRIYLHAFYKNTQVLLMHTLETFFFSVLPFIAIFFTMPAGIKSGFIALAAIIIGVCWRGYKIVDADPKYSVLHPFGAFLVILFLLDAAWIAATGRKTVWR